MTANEHTGTINKNIVKFQSLDPDLQHILREAVEARAHAYSPYSHFAVGACVQCMDGTTYRGCNIENCAFSVGICAERTAYAKAISDGRIKFKSVAVIAHQSDETFTMPCGACRQFMTEFGNVDIVVARPQLDMVFVTDLRQLLPHQFDHLSI